MSAFLSSFGKGPEETTSARKAQLANGMDLLEKPVPIDQNHVFLQQEKVVVGSGFEPEKA